MTSSATWHGPSVRDHPAWSRVLTEVIASTRRPIILCPTCGRDEVRLFFVPNPESAWGSAWLWCSSCKTCDHAQATVPGWWLWHKDVSAVMNAETPFDTLDRLWPEVALLNPGIAH
jgi:hypothetical protein